MVTTIPISYFCLLTTSILLLLLLLLSSTLHQAVAGEVDETFLVKQYKKEMREKMSHIRVYFHDVVSGVNPTSITIVKPPINKRPPFGQINMFDNRLTLGPESGSKIVGKAQGFYGSASQVELSLLMAMNFVFTTGKYNGSTITILGRNAAFDKMREMPVIGGSGLFRFARGYVQAQTHKLDFKTFDATVVYDIYVIHY